MLGHFHHLVSLVDRHAQSQAVGLKRGKEVFDGIQEIPLNVASLRIS